MAEQSTPDPQAAPTLPRLDEVIARFEEAKDAGQNPGPEQWLARYPEVAQELAEYFRNQRYFLQAAGLTETPGQEGLPHFEDYQILELIGPGGMGVVYKAFQKSAQRVVALKVIRPDRLEALSDEQRRRTIERFLTEAQAAAQLEHEHIVKVYEVGEVNGQPFYSMRYVQGKSLHELLGAGPLEGRQAAAYIEKVARAVHEAHQHGILHRDLKPHNILVEAKSDRPLVADFGLAKLLARSPLAPGGEGLTHTGEVMGTPPYMSPEQAQSSAWVTVASEVYSLGATLYALVTGRRPFQADTPVLTLLKVMHEEPLPPRQVHPKVPRDLETICLKCLQKGPAQRYGSAEALADDLGRFLKGEPISARPVGQAERLWRWCRRNPVVANLAAAVFVVLIAGTVISSSFAVQANDAKQAADDKAAAAVQEKDRADQNADEAKANEQKARRRLYISDMRLAQRAWDDAQIGRLLELLDGQRPERTGGVDLRGFDWHYWWRLCHSDLFTLKGHKGGVTSVAFSPDGKRLATGSEDGTVKLWDAEQGQEILTLKGDKGQVTSLAFSSDGKRLATATRGKGWAANGPDNAPVREDDTLRVWDAEGGREILIFRWHTDSSALESVTSMAFSPDGKRLLTTRQQDFGGSSSPGAAKAWDAERGQEIFTFPLKPSSNAALSLDGKRMVTAGPNGVRVWDTATGTSKELLVPLGLSTVTSVAISLGGQRLATADISDTVSVWIVEKGKEAFVPAREVFTWATGDGEVVTTMAFSPDGERLATANDDHTVKVRDALRGEEILTPKGEEILTLKGHKGPVTSVAFSPEGKLLATGSIDTTVKLWDAARRNLANRILEFSELNHLGCVAFSPNGKRLASGSSDNTVKLWDLGSWGAGYVKHPVLTLKGHTDNVESVAFSPNGRRLASGSRDNTVKLWDAERGQEILTLKGHTGQVEAVAFSSDGQRLASASGDYTVKVWDALRGQEILALKGHTKVVMSVAFSPNGKRLASGSMDNTVKVWDAEQGLEIFSLKGHTDPVACLAFSPDGRLLAIGGGSEAVTIWDARVPEHPGPLMEASWEIVRRLDADGAAYRMALQYAEKAARLAPDNGNILNMLGVAQYRAGQYAAALETLTRSDKIQSAGRKGHHPLDLAFLAMTQHQLGQKEKAQATLARLRETMKDAEWAKNEEAQAFLREAAALIESEQDTK